MSAQENTEVTAAELGHVHLLGIGGVGVSAVARLLLAQGLSVSGTDAKDVPVLEQLRAAGATVWVGFDAEHAHGADTVVLSSVIREDNPELVAARAAGARVLHRSQALAALMNGRVGITVAGTHGKTTTSSMTAVMLRHAGLAPTFAIGAAVPALGTNAELGTGSAFVAEADESDGSFLNYRPFIGIITNVEADHLDHYGTAEAVHAAFDDYAALLPADGLLVACADDAGAAAAARHASDRAGSSRVLTYGFSEAAQIRLSDPAHEGTGVIARLRDADGSEHRLSLQVPGEHNLLDAAAAYAVGRELGLSAEQALAGLAVFGGAARRFEARGTARGVRVYDDYAHHPTEVAAALRAARDVAGEGRVHVLFQPHLFSRTRDFAAEFGEALSLADTVWLLPIYAAREEPIPGVSSQLVADAVTVPHRIVTAQDAAALVAAQAAEGDLVMTLGAGDVTTQGARILSVLEGAA